MNIIWLFFGLLVVFFSEGSRATNHELPEELWSRRDPLEKLDDQVAQILTQWTSKTQENIYAEFKDSFEVTWYQKILRKIGFKSGINSSLIKSMSYSFSDPELIKEAKKLLNPYLKKNIRMENLPEFAIKSKLRTLPKSKIKIVSLILPQLELSAEKKLSELTVAIYICPNIQTSRVLFLTRAENVFKKNGNDFEIVGGGRARFITIDDSPFELAYLYEHAIIYSMIPKEGDWNDEDDRIGVIFKNIVLEFQMTTYRKFTNSFIWHLRYMEESDMKFALETLKEISKNLN